MSIQFSLRVFLASIPEKFWGHSCLVSVIMPVLYRMLTVPYLRCPETQGAQRFGCYENLTMNYVESR
jgi:hypothetical protein